MSTDPFIEEAHRHGWRLPMRPADERLRRLAEQQPDAPFAKDVLRLLDASLQPIELARAYHEERHSGDFEMCSNDDEGLAHAMLHRLSVWRAAR